MITIKILNAKQIVERERGFFASRIAHFFGSAQRLVEEEIVRQINTVFAENDIQAEVMVIKNDEN